jgi:serine/threonine protein kinase
VYDEHFLFVAFGAVWLATDRKTNQTVAIKKMSVTLKTRDFIINEIETQKSIRHPNIVALIDCYRTPDRMLWVRR